MHQGRTHLVKKRGGYLSAFFKPQYSSDSTHVKVMAVLSYETGPRREKRCPGSSIVSSIARSSENWRKVPGNSKTFFNF